MVHDQFTDKSFRIFAAKIRNFDMDTRDLVKQAEINYEDQNSLPETSFAWPEERRFAIHTPQHAVLSQIYASGENLPKHVNFRLEKAAELYGVKINFIEKVAEEIVDNPKDYLIPHRKLGKIENKEHVKQASDFFFNNYKKMDIVTRANAAATLVKKAREMECKVPPAIYKHAGLTQTSPRFLGEWLEVRSNLAKDSSIKEGFFKLASFVQDEKKFTRASRQDLIKIADTISILDEKAELTKHYDLTLPDPMMTVFNTTKTAESKIKVGLKEIPISKLMQYDAKTYGDILGDDILPEISDKEGNLKEAELLDVLRTLPADLQLSLAKNLRL